MIRVIVSSLLLCVAAVASAAPARVQDLKITVLSTMVADDGVGEWGFSALVEVDGHRILVDTGAGPNTVLDNARALGIDLSDVEDVVLTHNHDDHTGGLLALRRALAPRNPRALARVHVASAIFLSRPNGGRETNLVRAQRADIEAGGATFVVHDAPTELLPGVWFTGPVPRSTGERNWSGAGKLVDADGASVEDTIPEDSSLLFDTSRGVVLLAGCGHAGMVNTMRYARALLRGASVTALVGGFHLFALDDARLDWTIAELKRFGVKQILGAHCTGLEAVYRARRRLGLPRSSAIVAAVGSRFDLANGISAGGAGLTR